MSDIETQKILISLTSNVIQIVAIFVGIFIAIVQIRKGHENSLSLQKENIKNDHYSKLHNEIEQVVESLAEAEGDLSSCLQNISSSFYLFKLSHQAGIQNPSTKPESFRSITGKKSKLDKSYIQLHPVTFNY